jgi:hypothetical protein
MSLNLEEELELERLLLMMEHWDKLASPPVPLQAPTPASPGHEKKSKPLEVSETKTNAEKGFIDKLCDKLAGPGLDRPSGRALGKDSWMG